MPDFGNGCKQRDGCEHRTDAPLDDFHFCFAQVALGHKLGRVQRVMLHEFSLLLSRKSTDVPLTQRVERAEEKCIRWKKHSNILRQAGRLHARLGEKSRCPSNHKFARVIRVWLPGKLQSVLLSTHMESDKAAPASQAWGVINNTGCFR